MRSAACIVALDKEHALSLSRLETEAANVNFETETKPMGKECASVGYHSTVSHINTTYATAEHLEPLRAPAGAHLVYTIHHRILFQKSNSEREKAP